MTSPLATRRRAEDFARLVDDNRLSRDPKFVPLLDLVARLTPALIEPAPAFRTSLRERLVSAAEELPLGAPAAMPTAAARSAVRTPPRVRLVAAAASVALAGGMVGTAAAARNALPGDVLYTLKRSLERTEVAVTSNAESRGRHFLKQAENRLAETVGLVDRTRIASSDLTQVGLVRGALDDFVAESKHGSTLLTEAYRVDKRKAPLVRVREFVANAKPELTSLRPFLPPALMATYGEASAALAQLDQNALDLCPSCGTDPTGDDILLAGSQQPAPDSPAPATEPEEDASSPAPRPSLGGNETQRPGPFPAPLPPGPGPTRAPDPRVPDPSRLPLPPLPIPDPTITVRLPQPLPTQLPPLPLPTQIPLPLPSSIPLPLPSLPLPLPLPTEIQLPTSLPLPLPLPGGDLDKPEPPGKTAKPEPTKPPKEPDPGPTAPDLPLPLPGS